MIKKILHISDIHIRNIKRHDEYKEQLNKFINISKEIVSDYEFNEVRILITGDIFHQKIQTSNEQTDLLAWFLKELNLIAPTIIMAGNHDFMENNIERMDSITPIINMLNLDNIKYIDKNLKYKSGIYIDDNIVWCLYSIFNNYSIPDIKIERINYPDKKFIGLFHGALTGTKTDTGFEIEHGISTDIFDGCDVVMCGDIHKRNTLNFISTLEVDDKNVGIYKNNGWEIKSKVDNIFNIYKNSKAVFSGSFIQQDVGENISGHGFLLWDTENLEFEEYDVESDYGFYKFKITSIEDIENQTEEFVNF